MGLDDVDRPLDAFWDEQGETGRVIHDPIGRLRFVRQLETDTAALADDPDADVGVEAASGLIGSGQDLDRPLGERQHAPSLGGAATEVPRVRLQLAMPTSGLGTARPRAVAPSANPLRNLSSGHGWFHPGTIKAWKPSAFPSPSTSET